MLTTESGDYIMKTICQGFGLVYIMLFEATSMDWIVTLLIVNFHSHNTASFQAVASMQVVIHIRNRGT